MPRASRSWSRPFAAFGATLAALGAESPAAAIGIGETEPRLVVREEIYLVVHDPAARRQHMLYAARVEPSAPGEAPTGALLAVPVPAAPDVEVLAEVDLLAAVHALSASYEALAGGRAPAPPAPWSPRGATAAATAISLSGVLARPLPFDHDWLESHIEAGSWLAALSVTAPTGRLEIQTPTVRISFAADRPILLLREPAPRAPTPRAAEDPARDHADPDRGSAVAAPYLVSDVTTEPRDVAPSAEVVSRVLRTTTAATRACYDALLERRDEPGSPEGPPSGVTSVDLAVTISRRGEIRALDARSVATPGGPADALGGCVAAAVRAKGFPRVDAEWRFNARITFEPPRTRSRRTHLVILSAERGRWIEAEGSKASAGAGQDPPPPWKLVRELEPTWDDIASALSPEVRASIGLSRRDGRLWAAEYLDSSTDRRRRPDLVWKSTGAIPAPREPGTRAFAEDRARARSLPPATARPSARRSWLARSPRRTRALLAAAIAGAVVALALSMGRERRR